MFGWFFINGEELRNGVKYLVFEDIARLPLFSGSCSIKRQIRMLKQATKGVAAAMYSFREVTFTPSDGIPILSSSTVGSAYNFRSISENMLVSLLG